jgi:fructose-1,6-bisphosphatase/inositol monophosphatase family enzyme
MKPVDPAKLVAALETVAAEEILPRFRNLKAGEVTDKGGGDFVTKADEEAEKKLTQILGALLPGSLVVGEEAAHADPAVIGRISGEAPVWVIDPLDGTNNFARGNDLFAVMAALVVKGRSVLGAIHMPTRGETAVAEAGSGAFLGGARLATAAPRAPAQIRASIHTHYLPADIQPRFRQAAQSFGFNEEIYCAGRVYVGLAEGALDGALFWRTKPWDHAMGTLILREAGGLDGFADGTAYAPTVQGRLGLIAASGPEVWQLVRDALFPAQQR